MSESLEPVFAALRALMLQASRGMILTADDPGNVVLKTSWTEPGKKDFAWFGAVQRKKNYVSCHLMPLYAVPALRETIPTALRKRMQGKSCFNFKKVEAELFEALERTIDCLLYTSPSPRD